MNEDQDVIIEDHVAEEIQATTVEDGSPYPCEAPRQPIFKTVGMYAFPCIGGLIYLAVAIFVIVMLYRLVRATEKIASRLEGGITVKKEESDNTI